LTRLSEDPGRIALVNASTRPLRDAVELRQVLTLVLDRLDKTPREGKYRLVGTAAALLHGVPLPAGDIDLLFSERADVDRFGRALLSFPCLHRPSWLPEARQYFAEYAIEGIGVSASTVEQTIDIDTHECVGPGPWHHYTLIACDRHAVPTVTLELRLLTELTRNRPDRSDPLSDHLRRHGCDLALVDRGLRDRNLPTGQRQAILQQLVDTQMH
jgi:hypothetical protein